MLCFPEQFQNLKEIYANILSFQDDKVSSFFFTVWGNLKYNVNTFPISPKILVESRLLVNLVFLAI